MSGCPEDGEEPGVQGLRTHQRQPAGAPRRAAAPRCPARAAQRLGCGRRRSRPPDRALQPAGLLHRGDRFLAQAGRGLPSPSSTSATCSRSAASMARRSARHCSAPWSNSCCAWRAGRAWPRVPVRRNSRCCCRAHGEHEAVSATLQACSASCAGWSWTCPTTSWCWCRMSASTPARRRPASVQRHQRAASVRLARHRDHEERRRT